MGRVWFFDIQGWITLILGGLLALITLFTSDSHVHIPFLGNVGLPWFRRWLASTKSSPQELLH